MNSGTTRRPPEVAGQNAAERLMANLDYRLSPNVQPLDEDQVAVVLRALADHTALADAVNWRHDPNSPWPVLTSLGRWLHDVADELEGRWDYWEDA